MGWLYSSSALAQQKQNILNDCAKNGYLVEYKATSYGRHFWVKVSRPDIDNGKSIILLFLFEKHNGRWGCKDLDEHMFPYYFDCPKSLIKDHQDSRWRKAVMDKR
jgi:hypothetical protein